MKSKNEGKQSSIRDHLRRLINDRDIEYHLEKIIKICQLFEPKDDENRLLTEEDIASDLENHKMSSLFSYRYAYRLGFDREASILEQQKQAAIRQVFGKVEKVLKEASDLKELERMLVSTVAELKAKFLEEGDENS